MTADEVRGSFYVWAPRELQPLVGAALGYSPHDLQRGGRLQRLNRSRDSDFYQDDLKAERAGEPNGAISLYRKAQAERVKISGKTGDWGLEIDEVLKQRALTIIREHPVRHFAMTMPFLWRGALVTFPLFVQPSRMQYGLSTTSVSSCCLPRSGNAPLYFILIWSSEIPACFGLILKTCGIN
jgi:hypothetical protein